jgi:hypothetical protein
MDEIADRVDPVGARPHRAVDPDQAAAVELHARGVQPQSFDVRAAPGGDHEPVHLIRALAAAERHA